MSQQTLSTVGRRLALASLVLTLSATLLFAAPTYVYDPAGRLIGVVDGSGNAAIYNYDAVGNLLSITRPTAAVNVLGFNPNNGPPNLTVTIYGNGFSATPSQNTVRFNGTAAVVTSSSTSTIVASVPSGAVTGTISVTSPSGSATSTATFTVTSN